MNSVIPKPQHFVNAFARVSYFVVRQKNLVTAGAVDAVVNVSEGCNFHVVADAVFREGIEFFVRTFELEMLDDAVFGGDDEAFRRALTCIVHNAGGAADIVAECGDGGQTFGMDKEQGVGMGSSGFFDVFDTHAQVCRTAALDELHVLFGNLLGDPVSEVTIRYEKDVGVFDFSDDFYSGGGCDTDVADGFEVSGGVDISDDAVVGVSQFHLADEGFVHLVGHGAAG